MNEFISLSIPDWEFIHRPFKDNDASAYSNSKQILNFELVIEVNQTDMKKTFILSAVKSCLIISTTFGSGCIGNMFLPCSIAFFRT